MPKIALAGKGGAGKTMVASVLAYLFSELGETVYAIDADPNPTLGMALGFPDAIVNAIRPIVSLQELIRQRTGSTSPGSFFKLNPSVDDIPEHYCGLHRSIRLIVMGSTPAVNAGCACAENTMVKALVNHLILRINETVIMDMVAGTEHIGRGTASGVDAMIIVAEPSARSIRAGQTAAKLIKNQRSIDCVIIGNKITSTGDETLLRQSFDDNSIACCLPWSAAAVAAENSGATVYDNVSGIVGPLRTFASGLLQSIKAATVHGKA